jgi:hypothetical protein
MVASWRVNSAMSLPLTEPPLFFFCFLTFWTMIPWRRSVALTAV